MAETETSDNVGLVASPAGFVYRVLLQCRQELHWWQSDFLEKFRDPRVLTKATLVTPNGSGKSSIIIAGLALWWISVFKLGKFVIGSFDSKQLDHQCWPAITAHRHKFENEKGWRFIEREVHTPDGAFIIGFTTDDPGRAEGWHKIDDIDGPCCITLDEAKSIQDPVFDAVNRCTYNALAYVSSPGLNEGRFYASHTTLRKTPENPFGFDAMEVGLVDCPHIGRDRIDSTIAEYGIDHPFTQSTLFGKFMDADADTMFIVSKSAMKTAMEAKPPYVEGGHAAFCDFAAGRNENVMAYRKGNRTEIVAWRDANVMSSVGRFISEFRKRNLHPSETYGDVGGMGVAIISRFHEQGWNIIPVDNSKPPRNPIYENRGAEDWHEASKKIQAQTEILPNDPVLYQQATSRRMKFTSDGKLGAESKKDMAKRNIESPDRFDAVAGVWGVETALAASLLDTQGLRRLEIQARQVQPELGKLSFANNAKDVNYEAWTSDAWIEVWEKPIVGRAYLCVLNPFWHEDAFGDHIVIVVRAPFGERPQELVLKEADKPLPLKLVAKIHKPCRLDAQPLAQSVQMLTRWYGNCFVVPIANERGDVIESLRTIGLAMYAREDFEHILHGRKRSIEFGWESNEYNRSLWIGALSEAVRAGSVDCPDLETVMQLFQLDGQNAKSKPEAEALGVAIKEILRASRYSIPKTSIFDLPRRPDLSKAMIS